jgi:hypothetical protein
MQGGYIVICYSTLFNISSHHCQTQPNHTCFFILHCKMLDVQLLCFVQALCEGKSQEDKLNNPLYHPAHKIQTVSLWSDYFPGLPELCSSFLVSSSYLPHQSICHSVLNKSPHLHFLWLDFITAQRNVTGPLALPAISTHSKYRKMQVSVKDGINKLLQSFKFKIFFNFPIIKCQHKDTVNPMLSLFTSTTYCGFQTVLLFSYSNKHLKAFCKLTHIYHVTTNTSQPQRLLLLVGSQLIDSSVI